MAATVLVYWTRFCPYCVMTARLLESKGVAYEAVWVDREPQRRREMEHRSGRHSVPQIFIGEVHVGGYTELARLERDGRLDALLAADAGSD